MRIVTFAVVAVLWIMLLTAGVFTDVPLAFASATATPTVTPTPTFINSQGSAGVPITVADCAASTTKLLAGKRGRTSWTILPEGGDIRCELGTADDGAPVIAPSATAGFLFKSNVGVSESTLGLGSSFVTLRLDCCGVSGAVPVSTEEE